MTLDDLEPRGSTPVQPPDVTSQSPQKSSTSDGGEAGIKCVALYPYNSEEAGDLSFEVNNDKKTVLHNDFMTTVVDDIERARL